MSVGGDMTYQRPSGMLVYMDRVGLARAGAVNFGFERGEKSL